MRYIKYILILAAFGLFAMSCNDDPKGAGDAVVGFSQTQYTFKESAGIVKVPLNMTGEPEKYPVKVDVEATFVGGDIDTLIRITQATGLNITETNDSSVEIEIFNNNYENDDFEITLRIVNVSGAELSTTHGSAKITIEDTDKNPYDKLQGTWIFYGESMSNDAVTTWEFSILAGFTEDEMDSNFEKKLVCWGIQGSQDYSAYIDPNYQPVWYLTYDEETEYLGIQAGTIVANAYDFGITGYSVPYEVYSNTRFIENGVWGSLNTVSELSGTWNEEFNTITFNENGGWVLTIYSGGEYTGYVWGQFKNIVLTRK